MSSRIRQFNQTGQRIIASQRCNGRANFRASVNRSGDNEIDRVACKTRVMGRHPAARWRNRCYPVATSDAPSMHHACTLSYPNPRWHPRQCGCMHHYAPKRTLFSTGCSSNMTRNEKQDRHSFRNRFQPEPCLFKIKLMNPNKTFVIVERVPNGGPQKENSS